MLWVMGTAAVLAGECAVIVLLARPVTREYEKANDSDDGTAGPADALGSVPRNGTAPVRTSPAAPPGCGGRPAAPTSPARRHRAAGRRAEGTGRGLRRRPADRRDRPLWSGAARRSSRPAARVRPPRSRSPGRS